MKYSIIILWVLTLQIGLSQNRAPSCWLRYQDNFQGDILINQVRVPAPSPTYTYYCGLQWNAGMEGGGYCGIQEHPSGRNFIFSIWDPISSSDPITAPYRHEGTVIESFGGEGTGLKSWNFDIGWETGQWYSFVTRAWSIDQSTQFGFWVFNHTDQVWYHLITMDYPVSNTRFETPTGSFIEDWWGNGWNTREVHHKKGWKRKSNDQSWQSFTSSNFFRVSPDAGAANFIDNYDGGVENDYYFMRSGGEIHPLTHSNSMLHLNNNDSAPSYETIEVLSLDLALVADSLMLNWSIDSTSAPQFSYVVKIFDNPSLTGLPILDMHERIPHQRQSALDISTLVAGSEYFVEFSVTDVFDRPSGTIVERFFTDGTVGIEDVSNLKTISYYPNPVEDVLYLNYNSEMRVVQSIITDVLGNNVLSNVQHSQNEMAINLPSYLSPGMYFLTVLDDQHDSHTIKFIKM